MADTNPLDDIVDELVVFKHEDPNHPDGQYFSNNPMWMDSRIRDHWMARHSDEAKASEGDTELGDDDEDDDLPAYADMTNEDLRTELATRGLSVDGKKAELVKRLEDHDAATEE